MPLPFAEPFPEPEYFNEVPIGTMESTEELILPEPEAEGEPYALVSTRESVNNASSRGALYRTRIFYNGSLIDVVECDQPPPKFSSCQKQVRRQSMSSLLTNSLYNR